MKHIPKVAGIGVAAITVVGLTAAALPGAAGAVTQPPPKTIVVRSPKAVAPPAPPRAPTPVPPTPSYVPPVFVPYPNITTSAVNSDGGISIAVTPLATPVAVGDIVVATPPGRHQFVGLVTSIVKSGTEDVIATKPVSAMAALKPGSYTGKQDLSGASATTANGQTIHPDVTASKTLDFPLVSETFDCGTGSITLTADVKITPSITADVSVGWFSLNSAKFIAGLSEQASITLSSNSPSGATRCSNNYPILSYDVPVDIGPIVADVTFGVSANVTANLNGTISANVVQKFSGQAGVTYDGNNWNIVDTASNSITHTQTISGSNSAQVSLAAAAGLSLYDILEGDLNLTAAAGVETSPVPGPTWDLYASVDLNADVKAFGYTLWSDDLWNHKWILFETPIITTAALPLEHPGRAFSLQLTGTGGYGTLSYTLIPALEFVPNPTGIGGNLELVPPPSWLSLTKAGLLSGTVPPGFPTSNAPVNVEVTDTLGLTGTHPYQLPIAPLAVSSTSVHIFRGLPAQHLTASGVSGTATWAQVSGSMPKGLTLQSSGLIAGSPTPGTSGTIVARVHDSTGASATATVTITVDTETCTPPKPGQPPICS